MDFCRHLLEEHPEFFEQFHSRLIDGVICRVSVGVIVVDIVLMPRCDGVVVDGREPLSHNPGFKGHQFSLRESFIVFRAKVCCHLRSYDGREGVEGAGVDGNDQGVEIRHFSQRRHVIDFALLHRLFCIWRLSHLR